MCGVPAPEIKPTNYNKWLHECTHQKDTWNKHANPVPSPCNAMQCKVRSTKRISCTAFTVFGLSRLQSRFGDKPLESKVVRSPKRDCSSITDRKEQGDLSGFLDTAKSVHTRLIRIPYPYRESGNTGILFTVGNAASSTYRRRVVVVVIFRRGWSPYIYSDCSDTEQNSHATPLWRRNIT